MSFSDDLRPPDVRFTQYSSLILGDRWPHVQSSLSEESGWFLQVLMAAIELCDQWGSLWPEF